MRPRTQACVHLQHDGLPQRVDRWIGNLGEPLPEKRIQWARRAGERSERRIVSHRPNSILALGRHRLQDHPHVFARKTKTTLQAIEFDGVDRVRRLIGIFKRCVELNQILIVPLRIVDAENLIILKKSD